MPRSGIMLPYPYDERRLAKIGFPCYVQAKLDGVRCRVIYNKQGIHMLSSECNDILCLPTLRKRLTSLYLPEGTELDGELYLHGLSFERIFSITSRSTEVHEQEGRMEYHIFDMPSAKGTYHMRIASILALPLPDTYPPDIGGIYREENFLAYSEQDISNFLDMFCKAGYEGLVIKAYSLPYERRRSPGMLKIKPTKTDTYTISSTVPEVSLDGIVKEELGAFVVKDDDENIFSVGTGPLLTHANRVSLWANRKQLIGQKLTIKYQQKTDRGVPRFPVALSLTYLGDGKAVELNLA